MAWFEPDARLVREIRGLRHDVHRSIDWSLAQMRSQLSSSVDQAIYELSTDIRFELVVGFDSLRRELQVISSVLSDVLPYPVSTEARNLCEIGMTMLQRGFPMEAERKLLEAVDKDPSNFTVYVALGATYAELEREPTSEEGTLISTAEQEPKEPRAIQSHKSAGETGFSRVLEFYELAERNSANPAQRAYACQLQGRYLFSRGDQAGAEARLRRAVELCPESARGEALYALTQVLAFGGEPRGCIDALVTSIHSNPHLATVAARDELLARSPLAEQIRSVLESLRRAVLEEAITPLENLRKEHDAFRETDFSWFVPDFGQNVSDIISEIDHAVESRDFVRLVAIPDVVADLRRQLTQARAVAEDRRKARLKRVRGDRARGVKEGTVTEIVALGCLIPIVVIFYGVILVAAVWLVGRIFEASTLWGIVAAGVGVVAALKVTLTIGEDLVGMARDKLRVASERHATSANIEKEYGGQFTMTVPRIWLDLNINPSLSDEQPPQG